MVMVVMSVAVMIMIPMIVTVMSVLVTMMIVAMPVTFDALVPPLRTVMPDWMSSIMAMVMIIRVKLGHHLLRSILRRPREDRTCSDWRFKACCSRAFTR